MDTPLAVAKALREWHEEERYRLFDPYVLPGQEVPLVDTLMAFSRLLRANDRARRRITTVHDEVVAAEFDLSEMANHMGLFSRDVEFRSERIDGNQAVIVAQVADQVPLEKYTFVLHEGRWVYAPGLPPPSVPAQVRELAAGMEQFADHLEGVSRSVDEIRSRFRHRVLRRLRAVQAADTDARAAVTSRPTSQP